MFRSAEVEAFTSLAPFIRRNPRHMKRLINVYRMVRTLAARRGAEVVLDFPELTIRWIVICAQWPYTVNAMLDEIDNVDWNGSTDSPLRMLYDRVAPRLSSDLQRKLDDDPAGLIKLIGETHMGLDQLIAIQPFTLNFNPAIDHPLQASQAPEANDTPEPAVSHSIQGPADPRPSGTGPASIS